MLRAARSATHSDQSAPPITATVDSISASVAGSTVTSRSTIPSANATFLARYAPSTGFTIEWCTVPVIGSARRGAATL
jgi:hypothetical protein